MKSKKTRSIAAAAALVMAVSAMGLPAYAYDEFDEFGYDEAVVDGDAVAYEEVPEDISAYMAVDTATSSYSAAQKAAYDVITAACDAFLASDVTLSTDAFKVVQLSTALNSSDIDMIVADIKASGSYQVLDRVGKYGTTASGYNQLALFTKSEYRTPAGREALKIKLDIVSHPIDVSANLGDVVSFSVKAVGTGLTYQWQVSTNGGSTWANTGASGNKTSQITATVKEAMNGYKYRCIVSDGKGNSVTSSSASLTINDILKITSQPKDAAADAGSTVSFTVTASGTGLTYQWQVSTNGGSTWANTRATGNNTSKITATVKEAMNGYKYRCIVKNGSGKTVTSSAAALTVNGAVNITSQPKDVEAKIGSTVNFAVTASGTGLTYQWQVSTNGGSTWANTRAIGNSTSKITATVKEAMNGYKYRCIVKNSSGKTVTSSAATLTVSDATNTLNITSQPKDITADIGSAVSFEVKASGTGLTYQWQVSTNGGSTWANTRATGNNTSKITATVKEAMNGYKYRCVVKNSSGKTVISSAAALTVNGAVNITSQPKNVTAKVGSKVSFAVTASGTGLTYQWQVSTNGGSTWANTRATGNNTSKITATATEAMNGYKYRCVVKNDSGKTVTSSVAELIVT